MAVGRRFPRLARPDDAVRAGPVLDDHRLAEGLGELLADLPRADVGRAPGHRGHEDADRPAGKVCAAAVAAYNITTSAASFNKCWIGNSRSSGASYFPQGGAWNTKN